MTCGWKGGTQVGPAARWMVCKCIAESPRTVTSADWQNPSSINRKRNLVLIMLGDEAPKE